MVDRFLPARIDNAYRGRKFALWLFGLVVAVKILQSLMVILSGHYILREADGIPLDTYSAAAEQTVVAVWALLGLTRLIIYALCVLVLVRYRGAIPLMFAVLALHYLASQLLLRFVPLVTTGSPPGPVVNLCLFAVMIVGLALSLWGQGPRSGSPARAT